MYSSIEVAFGRFLFFGIISLIALPGIIRLLRQLALTDILMVVALSASGFWLYTIVLFYGVRLTNGVIAALIIGILPVTIILFSRPIFNRMLWLGLLALLLGIGALLIVPLLDADVFNATMKNIHISGILLLIFALIMWSWFALANSWFLKKHSHIKSLDYSSLMGVLSLLCMLPIFLYGNSVRSIIYNPAFSSFILWSAILGLGASWIANIFWAYSCKKCSPTVYGTLIVSETIFGLLYSFILQQRFPFWNEMAAIALLIMGVLLTIRSQR